LPFLVLQMTDNCVLLQVAYKKRERAQKRKEMEVLMKDNLLNILTVPGTPIRYVGMEKKKIRIFKNIFFLFPGVRVKMIYRS
jgi:hypothetical protein